MVSDLVDEFLLYLLDCEARVEVQVLGDLFGAEVLVLLVPHVVEYRVGQSLLNRDPLLRVEDQGSLQEVRPLWLAVVEKGFDALSRLLREGLDVLQGVLIG